MDISVRWLKEWVDVGSDVSALAEDLTLAGLEVGELKAINPLSPKIVVGEIIRSESHPSKRFLEI